MVEYTKPWLSLEQQVEQLASSGVDVVYRGRAAELLKAHRLAMLPLACLVAIVWDARIRADPGAREHEQAPRVR